MAAHARQGGQQGFGVRGEIERDRARTGKDADAVAGTETIRDHLLGGVLGAVETGESGVGIVEEEGDGARRGGGDNRSGRRNGGKQRVGKARRGPPGKRRLGTPLGEGRDDLRLQIIEDLEIGGLQAADRRAFAVPHGDAEFDEVGFD